MKLDCNKPNKGEQLIKNYLEHQGYNVIDVSKCQEYWTQDIDFIAIKGQDTTKIEVKYDGVIHRTRNLFIELLSDVDNNKSGWIDFCKADYLYYIDAVNNICYVIALDDVRHYLKTNRYSVKECRDYNDKGLEYKRSQGALVNIDDFSKIFQVEKIDLDNFVYGVIKANDTQET